MIRPLERYAATAYLFWPTGEREALSTPQDNAAPLLAQSPLAAARSWYWRLAPAQRGACLQVAAAGWIDQSGGYFPPYAGPTLLFSPVKGWRTVYTTCWTVDLGAPIEWEMALG